MGQATRFEAVLLASMGDNFIRAHRWARTAPHSYQRRYALGQLRQLEKMRQEFENYGSTGVSLGTYQPSEFPDDALSPAELEEMKQELSEAQSLDLAEDSLSLIRPSFGNADTLVCSLAIRNPYLSPAGPS
jgi:hypothetical protein